MKGICNICNKEFVKNSPNQKYCSDCQMEGYKLNWKRNKITYFIKYLRNLGYTVLEPKEEVGNSSKKVI